jgi:hypothetical protein
MIRVDESEIEIYSMAKKNEFPTVKNKEIYLV